MPALATEKFKNADFELEYGVELRLIDLDAAVLLAPHKWLKSVQIGGVAAHQHDDQV